MADARHSGSATRTVPETGRTQAIKGLSPQRQPGGPPTGTVPPPRTPDTEHIANHPDPPHGHVLSDDSDGSGHSGDIHRPATAGLRHDRLDDAVYADIVSAAAAAAAHGYAVCDARAIRVSTHAADHLVSRAD